MHTTELRAALVRDQVDLQREVILWQRWVRYGALAALAVLSLAFGAPLEFPVIPLLAVSAAYITCVAGTALYVKRTAARPVGAWLPTLLVTADIATLAALFYLSTPPQHLDHMLLLGVVPVQLSVFYFGWRQGSWAAALVAVSYLLTTLVAPPFVDGTSPNASAVILEAGLFALTAAVLVLTFGRFRERIDRLRMFCKIVEQGESVDVPTPIDDKRPDDVTLLARSFEAMRIRLAEQIGTDSLTGCLNRRALEARLHNDLRQAKRRGGNVAVLAVDLDHFKTINDTHGHPVGDLVLRQLSEIMRTTVRDTDAVARVGGDEFVILLADTDWQGALVFAERLRSRVDDFVFGPPSGSIEVTISVGVALARDTDPILPEMLLQEADQSMYKAKVAGRNRIAV